MLGTLKTESFLTFTCPPVTLCGMVSYKRNERMKHFKKWPVINDFKIFLVH